MQLKLLARRQGRIWQKSTGLLTLIALMLATGLTTSAVGAKAEAAEEKVLILDSTVTGGAASVEATEAASKGLAVDIVDDAKWSTMSTTDFAGYRAIILGDPTCVGPGTATIAAAEANARTWGSALSGNVVIVGTDPVFHADQGGESATRRAVDFAIDQVGKTGAYISLSCYYHGTTSSTPVPLLDGIQPEGFGVTGVGCYNNAHIVAVSPALEGLTDDDLSNWSCSVHEAFDKWPGSFVPLAIAKDFDSSFTASDGTQGPPYILASGKVQSFPLSLSPLADSGPAGTDHTVTAQLLDAATRNPVPLARLGFAITAGPNTGAKGTCSSGLLCLTDPNGHLSWTYRSNGVVGDDTIEVFIDLNDNAKADLGEPVTSAGMHWTLPAKTLIGLGDSVAAGHGLGSSDGYPDNGNAYPRLLAGLLGYAGSDYAITGACAATPGKDGGSASTPSGCDHSVLSDELPQVTVKPNIITLTVGANDIRFGDCFKAVVLRAGDNPCQGAAFDTNLKALSQNLNTLLARIKTKFPGVPIYMMRYYNPVPGVPSTGRDICPASRALAAIQKKNAQGYIQALITGAIGSYDNTAAEVQSDLYLKAVKIVSKLNLTIETAATAAGAKTVSLDFAGHDFCRTLTGGSVSDTWVYGPSLHGSVSGFGVINKRIPFDFDLPGTCPAPHREDSLAYYYSGTGHWDGESWAYDFTGKINCMPHPTIDGQRAIARAFKQAIGSG